MRKNVIVPVLVFWLSFLPYCLWSQQREIRGKVQDKETLETIPFAGITIKNAPIGTCSNNSGEFIFYYPDSLIDSDLIIKCLGYKPQSISLKSLITNDITSIYLVPQTYEMSEISVRPDLPSAKDIVKNVIKKLHTNYQRKPYYMEGFLRDRVLNVIDNKNTRLTEAAVEIDKKEFGNENNADKVKVLEIRNSYNYSKLGSSIKEMLKRAFWGYENDNPLYTTLQRNDFINSKILTSLIKNKLYATSVSGYTMFDNNPVVIVDIKEEFFEFMFMKIPTKVIYKLIRLYVDTKSYAMLKTEYYSVLKFPKDSLPKDFKLSFKQDTIAYFAVKQYEKIEDQYYLKYAGFYGKVHDQPDVDNFHQFYLNETELLINRVITDRKEFDRIKRKDLLEKDVALWDMKYIYSPVFWENYNILTDKPLDPKVKTDLEHQVLLKDQFIDAGIKNSK